MWVLALRPLRPQYACYQSVVLPSRSRSPPPSDSRRWPPDSRGTGHAQASADTVVLPFIFQRVGRLRLPLAILSPTPRRSRLFPMILPVRVVCIYTSMCVHLSTYVPPLSSPAKVLVHLCHLLCGPTRISAIALQRVLVGQSSIPDEQPPGAMVWRRVSRHFSVGQLGRFVA